MRHDEHDLLVEISARLSAATPDTVESEVISLLDKLDEYVTFPERMAALARYSRY